MGHWTALDGLRAVAVLAVIGIHVGVLPGGYLGVDVFFVLSGFLITTLLVREWDAHGGRISFRNFYLRRALRLFPALGCVILAAAALAWALGVAGGPGDRPYADATLAAIPWVIAFAGNLNQVLHPGLVDALGHTWSLAVEEQFYLLWPAALVLLMRRRVSRNRLALALALLAVAVMAYRGFLSACLGYGHDRIYYATDTHADGLLLGCALGLWLASPQPAWLRVAPAWSLRAAAWLAAVLLAVLFVFAGPASAAFAISGAVLASAVAVTAIVTGQAPMALNRPLASRWAVWLGRRSYGLYLWNPLLLAAAEAICSPYTGIFPAAMGTRRLVFAVALAVAIIGTFLVAGASYRFAELPALRLKRRFQR